MIASNGRMAKNKQQVGFAAAAIMEFQAVLVVGTIQALGYQVPGTVYSASSTVHVHLHNG